MATQFIRPMCIALLLLSMAQLACDYASRSSDKAERVWRQHERVFIDLREGRDVKVAEVNDACLFFAKLTNVEIPASSHNLFVDCYPTKESHKALELLRDWYSRNRNCLYWNETSKSVKCKRH